MDTSEGHEFENEEIGLEISTGLMQRSLAAQNSGIDSMKSTARTLLGASSVIVSLLAALNLINIQPKTEYAWLYHLIIFFAAGLYAIQMVLCISVLSPIKLSGPIEEDWDLLYQTFASKSEIGIKREQLDVYLKAIEENKPVVIKIRNRIKYASWLLPVVVIILLLLSVIPRYPI